MINSVRPKRFCVCLFDFFSVFISIEKSKSLRSVREIDGNRSQVWQHCDFIPTLLTSLAV